MWPGTGGLSVLPHTLPDCLHSSPALPHGTDINFMTAKKAIQQPLPLLPPRHSPRSSNSKTQPTRPRTYSRLESWRDFLAEMQKVLSMLDDTVRRFQPLVRVGDPDQEAVSPAEESEVRAFWKDLGTLVMHIACRHGWLVEVGGNGSNRALSRTDYLVRLQPERQAASPSVPQSPGSQPQVGRAQAEQQAASPSVLQSPGSQGPCKRGAESVMGQESGKPHKRLRVAMVSEHAASASAISAGEHAAGATPWGKAGHTTSALAPEPDLVNPVGVVPGRRRSERIAAGRAESPLAGTGTASTRRTQKRQQAAAAAVGVAGAVLACIEVKGDWQWDLRPHESLLQKVKERPGLAVALRQVYGDMVMDEVAFGAVSTLRICLAMCSPLSELPTQLAGLHNTWGVWV